MATDYHVEARTILRKEMESRGVTYGELSNRLMYFGLRENQASLYQKILRGSFQVAFFLQCLSAIRMQLGAYQTDLGEVRFQLPPLDPPTPVDEKKLALDRRRKTKGTLCPPNIEPGTQRRPRGRPKATSIQATQAMPLTDAVAARERGNSTSKARVTTRRKA